MEHYSILQQEKTRGHDQRATAVHVHPLAQYMLTGYYQDFLILKFQKLSLNPVLD
jgi:hypothetical protein